jgi:hypothetical protein
LSDEWDYYFARIDDAVASIFVDLGLRREAPIEARPWLLWVSITLQRPKADGLASNEESRTLNEMGASLDATVAAICGAQMVGRITRGGRREIYFYGAEPGGLADAAAQVMQSFADHAYETGSAFQPEWEHYLTLLYPSATNLQRMQNRRLLEELAAQSDVHELPRKVDHWMYFADQEGRAACRDTLAAIGFEVEDEGVAEEEGEHLPFSLVVSRVDSVDTHSINGITLELARLVGEHRGDYGGWGCEATTES